MENFQHSPTLRSHVQLCCLPLSTLTASLGLYPGLSRENCCDSHCLRLRLEIRNAAVFDGEQQSREGWELGRDLWSQESWPGGWSCNLPAGRPRLRSSGGHQRGCFSLEPYAIPTAPACTPQLWEGATSPCHFSRGRQAGGLLLSCFTVFLSVPQQSPTVLGNSYSGCKVN